MAEPSARESQWDTRAMTGDEETAPARTPGLGTARMEAFSDGVFAIAITLLVLEIAVPAGSGDDLPRALLDQWPSYLAYLVSFSTIGAVWLAHTVITEHLDRANSMLIRLNLLLLMVASFLPFPTRLMAEYVREDAPSGSRRPSTGSTCCCARCWSRCCGGSRSGSGSCVPTLLART